MIPRNCIIATVIVLLTTAEGFSVPSLKLPFPGGESWRCSQGNSESYTHDGDLKYAWDFHLEDNSDLGSPLVAPAAGIITYAGWAGEWGNTVIIDYQDPTDNSHGKITHLLNTETHPLEVEIGNFVIQGQTVGYCGSTGKSTGPHAHYQTQNGPYTYSPSIPSYFSEVCENNGVPVKGRYYISDNYSYSQTWYHASVGQFEDGFHRNPNYNLFSFKSMSRPFIDLYVAENDLGQKGKGLDLYGTPTSKVTQRAPNIYAQEFKHNQENYTVVLNPYVYNEVHYYLGVCYPVNGRIRAFWDPDRDGAPVCNEYYLERGGKTYAAQWFEVRDEDFRLLAYDLKDHVFFSSAATILNVPQDERFRDRIRNDKEKNSGDGIGGGGSTHEDAHTPIPQITQTNTPTPTPHLGVVDNGESVIIKRGEYTIEIYQSDFGSHFVGTSSGVVKSIRVAIGGNVYLRGFGGCSVTAAMTGDGSGDFRIIDPSPRRIQFDQHNPSQWDTTFNIAFTPTKTGTNARQITLRFFDFTNDVRGDSEEFFNLKGWGVALPPTATPPTTPTATATPTVTPTPQPDRPLSVTGIHVGSGLENLPNWRMRVMEEKTAFYRGETIQILAELEDITCPLQYRLYLYDNGVLRYNYTEDPLKTNNDYWPVNYFLPTFSWLAPGEYSAKLEVNDGTQWHYLGTTRFTISRSHQSLLSSSTPTLPQQTAPTATPTVTPTTPPKLTQQPQEQSWQTDNMSLTSLGIFTITAFRNHLDSQGQAEYDRGTNSVLVGHFRAGWNSGPIGTRNADGSVSFNLSIIQDELSNGLNTCGIRLNTSWFLINRICTDNDRQAFLRNGSLAIHYNTATRSFYVP